MKDYAKGKIYSLRSFQTDLIYVGSTVQALSKRLAGHKDDYRRYLQGSRKYPMTSFELLKFGDVYIELIEDYSCSNKDELERREGEIIRNSEKCVNKNKLLGFGKERGKIYYETHKKVISEQCKVYQKENRELIFNRRRKYRQENKQKIADLKKQEICCIVCEAQVTYGCLSRHLKSKKHLDAVNETQ